jgi:uncharacterized membrane protein YfcA
VGAALLIGGGLAVFGASVLGGVTGFGFSLVCAPLLLLAGVPLTDVVVVMLVIGLLTRLVAVVQLRRWVNRRRSVYLALGSVPGLLLGYVVRDVVGGDALKVVAGGLAVAVAGYLLLSPPPAPPDGGPAPVPWLPTGLAGAVGGFLGITTSLNGPPPVILLSRQHVGPREFVADMAVYLVICNGLALSLIQLSGEVSLHRVGPSLAAWLPGALLGNVVGLSLGGRVPVATFRIMTLCLVVVTGLATVATALGG